MERYDFQKEKELDRFNVGCLVAFFIFWVTAAITDNLLLAVILTVAFGFALPTLHEKIYKILNG